GIDLSDAPFDGLTPREQKGIEEWKKSFTKALKEMCAQEDDALFDKGEGKTARDRMDDARKNSVGDKGLAPGIYEYVKKKEAEYTAILDKKVANGRKHRADAQA